MKQKQILIVTSEFPPQPGGIGNHAYHLALYLSKNGYSVSVIADQRADDNEIEKKFDASLPFSVHRIPLRPIRFAMYVHRISKTFLKIRKADFVIATGKFSLWNVSFWTRFMKCPNLAIIHGSEVNFKSAVLKYAIDLSLKRFDTVVAVSNYTKQIVAHLGLDVQVIPNGIDINQWKDLNLGGIKVKGNPVLTTVGRVSTRKGQLGVIEMLPKLISNYPDIHYHCIGIPTEAGAFLKVAKSLQVEKYLTFHGVLNDKVLKDVLSATDVFVMLSKESQIGDVEGFGIAILEANAMGVPAIGAKDCGIEDAIQHGKTGFLIDGKDAKAFKGSLKTILEKERVFKANAIKWAHTHDWEQLIKRYLAFIP